MTLEVILDCSAGFRFMHSVRVWRAEPGEVVTEPHGKHAPGPHLGLLGGVSELVG